MSEYTSTAVINAPLATVWAVLTDARGYAGWNPEIVGIDGDIARGRRITARVRLGSGVIRAVKLRVTALDERARMEWVGGLPFGLFVGRRTFTLTPKATGVEFTMHLAMTGPLSSMIIKSVGDRQPEVDSFSAALKKRAEELRG